MAPDTPSTEGKQWKAFVLMPFEPEFDSIYSKLIEAPLKEIGYIVTRADSTLDQQNILADIIRGIIDSDLIVADLTTRNENVLYELGLSHALKKPTVLVAQSMDDIPFDLRSYRVQVYSTHFERVPDFTRALQDIGGRHKRGEVQFGNPITDFAPQLGMPIESTSARGAEREQPRPEVGEEIAEENGFLDFIVQGEQASNEIGRVFSELAEETAALGNRIKEHSGRVDALQSNPTPGAAAEAHKIALLAATDMNSYAGKIEAALPGLNLSIDNQASNFYGYLTWLEPSTESDKQAVRGLREVIEKLLEQTTGALESTRSYRDAVRGLKSMRISRAMNTASGRLIKALDGIVSAMEKAEAFCSRAVFLLDEKLGSL